MSVVIETTLGDITVDLFVKERPQTCLNFLKLCKLKYYNLNLFHTVNANFCAQTGDPTGKGDGGESIHGLLKGSDFRFYQGEVQPKIRHDSTGLISMVSHGKGMLGSQFIITLSPDLGSLDGEHCVFGKVVEGSEVLLKLNETIADEKHRPYQDIRVTHTVVLDDPFPDPSGMLKPPPSPVPPSTKDAAYSRIPADEALSDSHTQEELTEMVQAREAAARATILEMVGDLPDADVAPPENVLFVCKLNPVTSDHDLSLIFSRFGKVLKSLEPVKSCEVIRDAVTGESLQYAFVEFEDKKSCEEAYFKMDNVLIDERRIHVDFSQSVAKWRGKGRGVEMLVPTPAGGWGSKNNQNRNFSKRNEPPRRNRKEAREHYEKKPLVKDHERRKDNGIKNGESRRNKSNNKVVEKKEVPKKKRRPSPSSSSSSSETTSSSSSSDSSDSEPVKKKSRSRKANKVLVVVKTPRGRRQKKSKKTSKTSRKYDSDSDSDPPKRKKKKTRKRDSSSSSEESVAPKKKKRHSAEQSEKKKRSKKRKPPSSESSSDDSSEEEVKVSKKKAKRRKNGDDSSETESRKKRKKSKNVMKRRRSTSSSDNESDDSDSD